MGAGGNWYQRSSVRQCMYKKQSDVSAKGGCLQSSLGVVSYIWPCYDFMPQVSEEISEIVTVCMLFTSPVLNSVTIPCRGLRIQAR